MTREETIEELAGIFDAAAGSLSASTKLDDVCWDSMAKLSVIVLAQERFGKRLTGAEIRGFKTVGDVLAAMETN